jgi:hypothetical protein
VIGKAEWNIIQEKLNAEERRRLGDPPAVEELLAYERGELPPHDEERVRALLVAYPDLARALAMASPDDDGQPELSTEFIDAQWASLQKRLIEPGVLPFRAPAASRTRTHAWRAFASAAAIAAMLCGGLLWRAEMKLARPRVASDELLLLPDGQRGNGEASPVISPQGDSYLLVAPLINQQSFAEYRLELIDAATNRALWTSSAMPRRSNDTFAVMVPSSFLEPGRYQVVLYGVADGHDERLASYTLRVSR